MSNLEDLVKAYLTIRVEREKILHEYEEWFFDACVSNWVNSCSNELISDYTLSNELSNLLTYNINTNVE